MAHLAIPSSAPPVLKSTLMFFTKEDAMIHRDPKLPVRTCVSAPKWFAVVGDQIFPMPRREITRNVLLQQSGLPADHVLVRDRQSQHDELIPVGATIDLGVGNVFRLLPRAQRSVQTVTSRLNWRLQLMTTLKSL